MGTGLKSFVRLECCNFTPAVCMGMDFDRRPFNHNKPCLIMKGKKCEFFEHSVLPTANTNEDYLGVVGEYSMINASIKGLRRCRCGAELLKNKSLCSKCARKQKKNGNRQYDQISKV